MTSDDSEVDVKTICGRTQRLTRLAGLTIAAGLAAATIAPPGTASAATSGTELTAKDNGDCTVTFTLVNHTNSTYYQPDWWFEQEGPPPANGADPATFTPPWRTVTSTGTNWPYARWIGSPYLHSEVPDGVTPWKPGATYQSNVSPEGVTSERTIDPREATNPAPPAVSPTGTYTLGFRINNGTSAKDRVGVQTVDVTGCGADSDDGGSSNGSSTGSSNGSVDGLLTIISGLLGG